MIPVLPHSLFPHSRYAKTTIPTEAKAAHHLLTELRTTIATQPLPYQHGKEDRTLGSLYEFFVKTRDIIKKYQGTETFGDEASTMLNVILRPFTAKNSPGRGTGPVGLARRRR